MENVVGNMAARTPRAKRPAPPFVAPIPETRSWLRFIGLGIVEELVNQTRAIATLVKDVSDETQAMSMTVSESHDTLKNLARNMQGRKRPRKSVTRGRKK